MSTEKPVYIQKQEALLRLVEDFSPAEVANLQVLRNHLVADFEADGLPLTRETAGAYAFGVATLGEIVSGLVPGLRDLVTMQGARLISTLAPTFRDEDPVSTDALEEMWRR